MAAPTVRGRTAPVAGLSATSPGGTQIGDAVLVFTWEQTGAGIPTHTLQSNFVEIISHGHDDGSTDGRLSVAYKIATASGANSYQAYTSSVGTTVRTGIIVLQVGTHSLGDTAKGVTASAGATQTNTAVPNPPSVTLGTARDWLVIAASGWHLSASATVTPTVPTNYTNLQHVAGASTSELATAERALTAPASEDPGTFGDDVTPNGTASVTIGLANPVERAAALDGVGNISSSGTVIPGVTEHERSAAIAAVGSIASSATFFSILERAAALAATGDIAISGTVDSGAVVHERSAAISATGNIATSGTFFSILERALALAATGTIATDSERVLLRSASVAATGSISTSGTFLSVLSRSASMSATGSISVSGLREVSRSAALAASATISTDFERVLLRSASIDGLGVVSISGAPGGVTLGSVSLNATAGIAVSGQVQGAVERSASLTATATISVSGSVSTIWTRSVALAAVASIDTRGVVPPDVATVVAVGIAPMLARPNVPRIRPAGSRGRVESPDLVEVA